ncbi:unnamed protein product [Adineta steineri]|uniref:EGF-like domain-containing protein n=1 Tax=Adineta steineri TaxID=433720 RepID=A0A814QU56_9BILA|nr:unnamed protein product [Adineta steineri]CAF1124232.1 unnamed protein product [Adineta steineri]
MSSLTCYTHLQCDRGTPLICLDWTDICNGIIDCLDGGQDEEDCWQLEVNDCLDTEYRCRNGQCIPKDFYRDDEYNTGDMMNLDCLDGSDELFDDNKRNRCARREPTFQCEEATCRITPTIDTREFKTLSSSSCINERGKLLMQAMLSVKENSVNDTCWRALMCSAFTLMVTDDSPCYGFCYPGSCTHYIENNCPDLILLPAVPLLFGHVHLIYTNKIIEHLVGILTPTYVCYNNQHCSEMPTTITLPSLNNATCRPYSELPYPLTDMITEWDTIFNHVQSVFRTCTPIVNNYSTFCNISTMYQCFGSSKCISIYRPNDGIRDCYHEDDENFVATTEQSLSKPFKNCYKCQNSNKCINHYFLNDGLSQCPQQDDETNDHSVIKHVSFQTICDGFTELWPVTIEGREETDETQCEQWPCNNVYTHCDGIWNCLNGSDELNCNTTLPRSNCTSHQHLCVSPITNKFMCLSIEQANDNFTNCLGATDEPRICRISQNPRNTYSFYCENDGHLPCIHYNNLCNGYKECKYGEDEEFCEPVDYQEYCFKEDPPFVSDVRLFFCHRLQDQRKRSQVFFLLGPTNNFIRQTNVPKQKQNTLLPSASITRATSQREYRCHHGIDIRIWLGSKKNSTTITSCLCPPNFYGNTCQYQNQRVSLTIQIRAPPNDGRTPFAFVVSLIDNDDQVINSYEQLTYLSAKACQKKINIYLLYLTRPKNMTKHYSIHINAYEKISLVHRTSWLIPLNFPFLPVHRIATILTIPARNDVAKSCLNHLCIHGQCTKYANNNTIDTSFCLCNQGWTGRYCNISYTCNCANNSLCAGVLAENQSICVCPLGIFGERCFLNNIVCQSNPCDNRGQCMPVDENTASNKFTCICPEGFSGNTCQINDTKIVVSFEKGITLSQSIIVHFIQASKYKLHERSTIFKKILVDQNSATIYWSYPFAVMLIETSESTYYLAVAQETYVASTTVMSTINPSHRCAHINELFNKTFVKSHILHRIKYYHTPCQNRSSRLLCFYDDIHICLCTTFEQKRLANCFEFDHHMKHDCIGQNTCENGAKCFQDNLKCPQASLCMCPECFYGTQCQFTTKGFGLSLDAVLGYHIQPHVALQHQSSTVQPHPLLALADASCCKVDEIVKTPKTSVGNATNKIIALFVS